MFSVVSVIASCKIRNPVNFNKTELMLPCPTPTTIFFREIPKKFKILYQNLRFIVFRNF